MATTDRLPMITLRNANILPGRWRNFGGEARFKDEGKRTFNLKLDEETALAMQNDGLNVKPLMSRDDPEEIDAYRVEVKVNYSNRPPQVWLVSGGQRTLLDEGAVNMLDYADIEKASLQLNPSPWNTSTGSGIALYLHKAVIYLRDDELDLEMRDIPVSGNHSSEGAHFDDLEG